MANSSNFNNPGNSPGRIISNIRRHAFPSGQVVELREIKVTGMDAQGILRTEKITEIHPPLADGALPKEISKIFECANCLRIFGLSAPEICPLCALTFCRTCMVAVPIETQPVRICCRCEQEVRVPKIVKFTKKLLWD